MSIKLKINNGRSLVITQCGDDGPIHVNKLVNNFEREDSYIISAGDFVTMLNWYQFQKSEGNINLTF